MWYAQATAPVAGLTVAVVFAGLAYNRSINVAHFSGIPSVAHATSGVTSGTPSVSINGITFNYFNTTTRNAVLSVFLVPSTATVLGGPAYAIALQVGVPNPVIGPPSPWSLTVWEAPGAGASTIVSQLPTASTAQPFPVPKIIYDPGTGPVTLNFSYPDTGKPYGDILEAQRNDTISSSGSVRQAMLRRVDVKKELQIENVPWADLPAWAAFIQFVVAGGTFLFYPDSTSPLYATWELADEKFSPKFSVRGISKFTLNMRRVPNAPFAGSIQDLNDPTYGDVFNWQRFMFYALQGGSFAYYPDATLTAFQTWEVVDNVFKPAFASRGLSKFTVNMRLVPGGAFSL
jgi:hypothetical protein